MNLVIRLQKFVHTIELGEALSTCLKHFVIVFKDRYKNCSLSPNLVPCYKPLQESEEAVTTPTFFSTIVCKIKQEV